MNVYIVCTVTRRSKQGILQLLCSLSDACDPSWRNTRDGIIGLAYAVSIMAFILGAAMVWTHIYYHKSKQIQYLRQLRNIMEWVQLFQPKLSHGKQEASCFFVNIVGPWNAIKHIKWFVLFLVATHRLVLTQSCY